MRRSAFAVFLLVGAVAIVTALTMAMVGLTGASWGPRAIGHFPMESVAALPSDKPLSASDGPSQPYRATPLPWPGPLAYEVLDAAAAPAPAALARTDGPSEPVSHDAPDAAATATAALPPPPDDQA